MQNAKITSCSLAGDGKNAVTVARLSSQV